MTTRAGPSVSLRHAELAEGDPGPPQAGCFLRRHVEAMVFCYPADGPRTGDAAVRGSQEYADWSEQLLPRDAVEENLDVDFAFQECVPQAPG
ncbi:hypothetical protein ABZY44_23115 [Streptomyces sp. NPDC006544]|uniref:hypothetical protein n=1 Tax=Streptomyces sp. NPDC006544 TaxID=3154583 RepID=UPI0033B71CF5